MSARKPRDKGPNGRAPSKPLFAFGTDEEVFNRGAGDAMGGLDHGDNPTSFRQIAGKMAGGSINRAPLQHSGRGDRKNLGPSKG